VGSSTAAYECVFRFALSLCMINDDGRRWGWKADDGRWMMAMVMMTMTILTMMTMAMVVAMRWSGAFIGHFRAADVTLGFRIGPQSAATPNLHGGHSAVNVAICKFWAGRTVVRIARDRGRPRVEMNRDRGIQNPER
jgi:hypothetical protein